MPAEGMVHALELVHRLVVPGGVLIDIHPTGQPPDIEITLGDQIYHLGELQESDDFIEYRQAEEALHQAVEIGLFYRHKRATFEFLNHAAELDELKRYLQENWTDAVWPEQVDLQAAELRRQLNAHESQATLRENAYITRFLRLE